MYLLRDGKSRRILVETAKHGILIVFCLITLFPLVWVVLLSLKSLPDAYTGRLIPEEWDFTHYWYALTRISTLPRNLANSIVVTTATVFLTVIAAVSAGFALVYLPLWGRTVVIGLLTASLFFPSRILGLIAVYEIQKRLGILNTSWGLIFPYVTLSLAIGILIMRGIFEGIPRELYDAARIDGCSSLRSLVQIMVPVARNGIVVVAMVSFVAAWGEYLLATTLTNDQDVRTMPVVLAAATGGMGQWAWPRIAAVYVITVTPPLIAFAFGQRWFMRGLQEGALKG